MPAALCFFRAQVRRCLRHMAPGLFDLCRRLEVDDAAVDVACSVTVALQFF